MCKYCQLENRENISTLYSTSFDDELKSGTVTLKINEKQLLEIKSYCWDTLRETHIGIATAFDINYCPWCGRKLTKN